MSFSILSSSCIIFATLFYSIKLSVGSNNETERLALLEIKAKISNDPLRVMNLWNDTHHFCEWYGVTCTRTYEDVTILDLHSAKLTGTLSSHIGNLSFLKVLRLDINNFGGRIPPEIGRLHSLRTLWLSSNSFRGEIPSNISNCYRLTGLNMEENMLSGTIPSSIFHLSLLTGLYLRKNDLHGDLPSELGNTLPLIKNLYLGSNRLTGQIPASISNSSNLESLQLNDNKLQGQVPSLHKLAKLSILSLFNNSLGHNKLGDLNFVSSLSNATVLEWLQIDQNNFSGVLPQSICNFSMLTQLVIYSNNIVGEIPKCIGNLAKLENFVAYDNTLSGTLPQSIGKLRNMYTLKLGGNQLSGFIPQSIGNITKLSKFSLSNNRFEGEIPASLGSCASLLELYLNNNTLNGTIPSQLFTQQTLSIVNTIDLTRNQLTGNLPEEVGKLRNLRIFLVTRNKLSGKIPSSLSSCTALEFLYLSKNEFHGIIPDELSSLKGLFELDLSYNNLSGEIPPFLATLHLVLLNISHNNLEGKVPFGGVFDNATIVLVSGNSRLCGGIPELKLAQCDSSKYDSTRKRKLIVIILCSFFGAIFPVVVFVLLCKLRQRKRTIKEPASSGYLEGIPNLSYQTLSKATKGFSSEFLIGSGTFGFVYQGILKDGGLKVAIKVFKLEYHGALKSFMAECEVLRSIRHRNLLKVITSCSSVDNQGRDFKALVYEYMENGSLEDWLHPRTLHMNSSTYDASRYLDLRQRLDIAVGVALSVDYLHHQCSDPIVHCDIKPSNVLLDNDMVAHVGDFGISKILIENTSGYHRNQTSSFGVRGTIGYTPPEYGLGESVSTSGDVYSFGILLLELFTGKRPTHDMFKGGVSLHSFVKNALPHEIATILDHDLLNDIDNKETQSNEMLEALTSTLRVALSCSAEVPRDRLDMTDVATRLSSIRNTANTLFNYHFLK